MLRFFSTSQQTSFALLVLRDVQISSHHSDSFNLCCSMLLIYKYCTHGDLFRIPFMMGNDVEWWFHKRVVSEWSAEYWGFCFVLQQLRLNANSKWNSMHKLQKLFYAVILVLLVAFIVFQTEPFRYFLISNCWAVGSKTKSSKFLLILRALYDTLRPMKYDEC